MQIIRIILMSQIIPVNGLEWVKYLSQFKEGFTKHYDENSDKSCILDVGVDYPKNGKYKKA